MTFRKKILRNFIVGSGCGKSSLLKAIGGFYARHYRQHPAASGCIHSRLPNQALKETSL
ncbi:hypothetical protein [Winslowiella toletana]|uniref:hypothetical protein n=1 Tax=Winslowiella toletana TaxID=92490 RepID=UPI0028BE0481|nr:hypothetical protein [Winslowiella toletana]WNN42727.1 hypothetical protein RIN69_13485 [Winslowiella toletana]